MAQSTLDIVKQLYSGFDNNPDNRATLNTLQNAVPGASVYRGGKYLINNGPNDLNTLGSIGLNSTSQQVNDAAQAAGRLGTGVLDVIPGAIGLQSVVHPVHSLIDQMYTNFVTRGAAPNVSPTVNQTLKEITGDLNAGRMSQQSYDQSVRRLTGQPQLAPTDSLLAAQNRINTQFAKQDLQHDFNSGLIDEKTFNSSTANLQPNSLSMFVPQQVPAQQSNIHSVIDNMFNQVSQSR